MPGAWEAIESFFGMGDTIDDAKQVVGSAVSVGNGIVNPIPSAASMVSGTEDAVGSQPVGINAPVASSGVPGKSHFKKWSGDALEPIMGRLAVAALIPKRNPTAPLGGSGHGVSANASSNGQVIGQVEGLAGGDPLQGLSGFKNLL
ncbi:hypothetical protein DK750_06920 [Salmonella enterica subsp. enterica serovar Rovaniemi]|nr:hypothetical protein [Salmonella enterica subsp. enterica serovar Rovaniemi]